MMPEGWKVTHVGELCQRIHYGYTASADTAIEEPKLLRITDIQDGSVDWSSVPGCHISPVQEQKYILKDGDIVFARTGATTGKSFLLRNPPRSVFASYLIRLQADEVVLPEWLYAFFQSDHYWNQIKRDVRGGAQPNLNATLLSELEVLLPPLPEQRRIAAILGTWDRAIRLTEQRIAAQQQRKRALMQHLLTGRRRFRSCVKSPDTRDTPYGPIPTDWTLEPFKHLVQHISRVEPVCPDTEYRLLGVRWYVAGAHIHDTLPGHKILTDTLSRVEEGDILYNKMWVTKGAFGIAKAAHHGTYGTTEYPQFRANPQRLNVDFLEQLFHNTRFLHDATALCRGTTGRARLNPGDFLELEIPLPPLAEQQRIAAVLQTADNELALLAARRAALQRQKHGLMQQLLTGRVRVPLPEPHTKGADDGSNPPLP